MEPSDRCWAPDCIAVATDVVDDGGIIVSKLCPKHWQKVEERLKELSKTVPRLVPR